MAGDMKMLFKNMKFFTYSHDSLEYKEVRFFKTKLVTSVVAILCVLAAVVLVVDDLMGDPLGLGDVMSRVIAENRELKRQLRDLAREFDQLQNRLEAVAERGNELRLMVDLPKLDDDVRVAGAGGRLVQPQFTALGAEASDMLASSRMLLDKLDREINLQQKSCEDILRKYEYNKEFFQHLPAIKPSEGYYSVNGFGMRVHPVLRVYRMHEGVDIITDVGSDVYAAGNGVVRYAGRTQGGYGAVVEINHGYHYSTLYAHLSKVLVKPGQRVKRGELIARTGRSGLVSGPHLHYEVRYKGRKQNPVDYFFDDVRAAKYRIQLAEAHRP